MKITAIRLTYRLTASPESEDAILRVLDVYAEKCPAYQSVKGCIACTWELELAAP